METVGRFSDLFSGRTDFLGSEDGGCIRLDPGYVGWAYQGHLTGSREPIGIYPVQGIAYPTQPNGGNAVRFCVKFGAVDIDEQDLGLAVNLWKALKALDITAWVEKSRSKGYHVWVFSDSWVPAALMRSVLQVACDVVGYSPKEIYPKQTELADGSPGNYIRLPYPRAMVAAADKPPTSRYVLQMETPDRSVLTLEDFVRRAWENRCSRSVLESAAALAKPPKVRARLVRALPEQVHQDHLTKRLSGKAFVIYRDGPLDGSDRSGTLFKLGHLIKQEGYTPEEAFLLLKGADERWGKFFDRADGEDRLWEIVERCYNE